MCNATGMTDELNDLITTSLDGVHGYKQAAEHASDATLKSLFTDYASQRSTFASELQTLVSQMGGTPTDTGSVAAAFHRGWIGLKDAVTSGDKGILAECVRGEEHAVKDYQSILGSNDVTPAIKTLLSQQHGQIDQALTHMKMLHGKMA